MHIQIVHIYVMVRLPVPLPLSFTCNFVFLPLSIENQKIVTVCPYLPQQWVLEEPGHLIEFDPCLRTPCANVMCPCVQ